MIDPTILFVIADEENAGHSEHPEWPKGDSGVTIGVGDDLGYRTPESFTRDWGPHLAPAAMAALLPCVGVKGATAQTLLPSVRGVTIPWDTAVMVFTGANIPTAVTDTSRAFPGADQLHPWCFAVLVSLVYNRGGAMGTPGDDRRREMRLIRDAIARGTPNALSAIPGYLLSMRRLWPAGNGLVGRRTREAWLFSIGMDIEPPADAATSVPPAVVRGAQRALTAAGFQPGPADGLWGRKTAAALSAFQRAHGGADTGRLDPATLAALGILPAGRGLWRPDTKKPDWPHTLDDALTHGD